MEYAVFPLGDRALTVRWGDGIDEDAHSRVMALFDRLSRESILGVLDLIPAYQSLTVLYDPLRIREQEPGLRESPYAWLRSRLEGVLSANAEVPRTGPSRTLEIPVCYEQPFCLGTLPLPPAELGSLHSARTYKVYMLGFLPGFAYMGTVDPRIAYPRKSQPAPLVPAGSVGIAGLQTGVYPFDTPGGWNIIGRTPLRLFEAGSSDPVFFRPGDRVRFIPISQETFHAYPSR